MNTKINTNKLLNSTLQATKPTSSSPDSSRDNNEDLSFEEFTSLCMKLEDNASSIAKKNIIQNHLTHLSKEHTVQTIQLLLPAHGKDKSRIYHLKVCHEFDICLTS